MSIQNNKLTSIDETDHLELADEEDELELADEEDELDLADEENELDLADEMPSNTSLIAPESFNSFIDLNAKVWKVMIVDDEAEVHQVIRLILNNFTFQGKSLTILSAYSGKEAKSLLKNHPDTAFIFLDVVMEKNDAGLQVVKYIRETLKNQFVRIVIHTGQPGEAPDESVIVDYDINDYKLKSEMTQRKVFVTAVALLRAYRDLITIEINKIALKEKNEQLQIEIIERQRTEEQLNKLNQTLTKLNSGYERFVPRQFLNLLNKESVIDIGLGDQIEKEMTILFTDIREFTALSETMTPQETFNFINSFFSKMVPIIRNHDGFIDKYIGDAIMALFCNVDGAVQAGINMLKALADYNTTRVLPERPPIKIGIGINTGLLMLGTIGGQNRMDSTVISDAVNLASRVEQLTKTYGASLLITKHTYTRLTDPSQYHIRMIDTVKVKGKSEKVTIYEVFDVDEPESVILKNKTSSDFNEGLALSHRDKFSSAKPFFEKVLQVNPNDRVAQVYLERCDKILSIKIPDKPKILIVDDSPLNLKLLSYNLNKNNFEVIVAKEGKRALELAELKQPHLILLDVVMPKMDGFEVCRQLKANPKMQDIPVIFITALSETEDKIKGFQLGGIDYITKPFNWEEMLIRMKTHLHLSHLQRQSSWYVKAFKKMQFETSFTDDI